jgi:hypothetical protein
MAAAVACILGAAFAWPLLATSRAAVDGRAPVLTRADREQYIVAPSAGNAAEQAVDWLQAQAAQHPITIVTGLRMGLRNDYIWLQLRGHSNMQLYCDESMPPLRQSHIRAGTFIAGTEQWVSGSIGSVTPPADGPLYYLAESALNSKTGVMDVMPLRFLGLGARFVHIFLNPPMTADAPPLGGIAVYQIWRPAPAMEASANPTP